MQRKKYPCVPAYITSRWRKVHASTGSWLDKNKKNSGEPVLVFPKMAAKPKRGRKKANFANLTNKITGYLSHPKFDPSEIIKQLIDNCVRPGLFAATSIINNIINNFEIESSSRHTGSNVLEKTLKTWTLKYPWLLIVNKESTNKMTLMCDLCSSLMYGIRAEHCRKL